ncbi:Vegetative incompatibility HET-E-1, partial [Fusarium agapanthi]
MIAVLSDAATRLPHYGHPMLEDCLYRSEFTHTSSGANCDNCDRSQLVSREMPPNTNPLVHYGRVASGNQVVKDTLTRDSLSKKINNICFEMEAAGAMDCFPCLVIRGICDYSDSHKNKGWQKCAALIAAAYAKELLMSIPPQLLQPSKRRKAQYPTAPEHISAEADECLRAMFVTDSSLDREGILDAKGDICEGTCEWILSTEEFQAWDQNLPHLLWISAPPGMGKTFMSIYLSKHFEATAKDSEAATILFFCDGKVEYRNTAVSVLRGLIHQLISHQPNLVNTIMPQWKQQSRRLFQEDSFGTLWKLFETMLAKSEFETIYCVLDALDECEANSLPLLLRKFERLSQGHLGSSTKMKLVCLSRMYPENIPEALLLFTKIKFNTMAARKEDVNRFISAQVRDLAKKKKLNREMCSRLEETFQQKSEGTFLWVSFMCQDLHKQRPLDFEASLKTIPVGLDAVYERILQNIDFEKRRIINSILYWIMVVMHPFTIPQLCEAVDMKPEGSMPREQVCIELIQSCSHLLQITILHHRDSIDPDSQAWSKSMFNQARGENDRWDYRKQMVTFLHQSAKDYLAKSQATCQSPVLGFTIPQFHEHATTTLIQYLERITNHKGPEYEMIQEITDDLPLAEYAVESWYLHFRELEDIPEVIQKGANFFGKDSKVRYQWQGDFIGHRGLTGEGRCIPLLHMAAYLGLDRLAIWCLERDGERDFTMEWGVSSLTALQVAAEQCEAHVVALYVEAGADTAAPNSDGINAI